jgi:hypothetical protein
VEPPNGATSVVTGEPAVSFRNAASAANLESPSSGPRRREWNSAYTGITSGKQQPADMLREIEADIATNKKLQDTEVGRGDSTLADDISKQEKLADLIRSHFNLGEPKQRQAKADVQNELQAKAGAAARKAQIRPPGGSDKVPGAKKTAAEAARPGPMAKVAPPRKDGTPQTRAKAMADQATKDAEDNKLNAEQRTRWADAIGNEPPSMRKNDTAGNILLDETADLLRNGRTTRAKAATRLRDHAGGDTTPEALYLRRVADTIEADTSKPAKRVPLKKAAPKAPPNVDAAEAALAGRTDKNILTGLNGLSVGDMRAVAEKWGIDTRGEDKKLKLKAALAKELAAHWKATPSVQRKKEAVPGAAPEAPPVKKVAKAAVKAAAPREQKTPLSAAQKEEYGQLADPEKKEYNRLRATGLSHDDAVTQAINKALGKPAAKKAAPKTPAAKALTKVAETPEVPTVLKKAAAKAVINEDQGRTDLVGPKPSGFTPTGDAPWARLESARGDRTPVDPENLRAGDVFLNNGVWEELISPVGKTGDWRVREPGKLPRRAGGDLIKRSSRENAAQRAWREQGGGFPSAAPAKATRATAGTRVTPEERAQDRANAKKLAANRGETAPTPANTDAARLASGLDEKKAAEQKTWDDAANGVKAQWDEAIGAPPASLNPVEETGLHLIAGGVASKKLSRPKAAARLRDVADNSSGSDEWKGYLNRLADHLSTPAPRKKAVKAAAPEAPTAPEAPKIRGVDTAERARLQQRAKEVLAEMKAGPTADPYDQIAKDLGGSQNAQAIEKMAKEVRAEVEATSSPSGISVEDRVAAQILSRVKPEYRDQLLADMPEADRKHLLDVAERVHQEKVRVKKSGHDIDRILSDAGLKKPKSGTESKADYDAVRGHLINGDTDKAKTRLRESISRADANLEGYRRGINEPNQTQANKELLGRHITDELARSEWARSVLGTMEGGSASSPELVSKQDVIRVTSPELAKLSAEDLKQSAKDLGIKLPQGATTRDEVMTELAREMIRRDKAGTLPEGVPPTRLAKKAAPKPPPAKIDVQSILPPGDWNSGSSSGPSDAAMLDHIQRALDGESIGAMPKNASPAAIGRYLDSWNNSAGGPGVRIAMQTLSVDGAKRRLTEANTPEERQIAETQLAEIMKEREDLRAQVDRWQALADKLKATRRTPAKKATPAVKAEVAQEVKAAPPVKKVAKKAAAAAAPEVSPPPVKQTLARAAKAAPTPAPAKKAVPRVTSGETPESKQLRDAQLEVRAAQDAVTALEGKANRVDPETVQADEIDKDLEMAREARDKADDTLDSVKAKVAKKSVRKLSAPSAPTGSRKYTEAELQDMTLGDLVDIESERGIRRTSVARGDRIKAIMDQQNEAQAAPVKKAAKAAAPSVAAKVDVKREVAAKATAEPSVTKAQMTDLQAMAELPYNSVIKPGKNDAANRRLDALIKKGLVTENSDGVKLTDKGRALANANAPAPAKKVEAAAKKAAPKAAGPAVKDVGSSIAPSGSIVKRDRPNADQPIHLPNGGSDQGNIHLDSELGKLWADLYADDREPNSFVNEIARMGDEMGNHRFELGEFVQRLKKMKTEAVDSAIADRIQKALDAIDAPPVKLDLPPDIPATLRKAFEDLAAIPTARISVPAKKKGEAHAPLARVVGNTHFRSGEPSVIQKKQDILRQIAAGDPEFVRGSSAADALSTHDLHEGTDAATTMWRIMDLAVQDPAVKAWLKEKTLEARKKAGQ